MSKVKIAGLMAVAVATALASVAANATFESGVQASFYVSGASAARQVPNQLAVEFCKTAASGAGFPNVFKYNLTAKPNDYKITVCTLKANSGTDSDASIPSSIAGLKVAFYTRAGGGSLYGVKPIAVPQKIAFIDSSTCATATANGPEVNCSGITAPDRDCVGCSTGDKPDIGISDEDPDFICKAGVENYNSAATGIGTPAVLPDLRCTNAEKSEITNQPHMTITPAYQTVWTIQAGVNFPVNNVSTDVIRGIFSGDIKTVASVQKMMGQTSGLSTKSLKVCNRDYRSGTRSGWTQMTNGYSFCGDTDLTAPRQQTCHTAGTCTSDGTSYMVFETASSGDNETCLTGASDLDRSIGINALENAGVNANLKELSIDGVAPTIDNTGRGAYRYLKESTAQFNDLELNDGTITRSSTTQRNDFASWFVSLLQTPSRLVTAGLGGELGIPTVVAPTGNSIVSSAPVGWTTNGTLLGGSNCSTPKLVYPVP